mgnify:FL=1
MENSQYKMHDIHMHIIPGADDGSWSLDMSLSMIYMAFQQGIERIIATPHSSAFDQHPELVKEGFQELKDHIAKRLPWIRLYSGCEVACSAGNMKKVLERLQKGSYPTLNHTDHVLTEFSVRIEKEEAVSCAKQLLAAGWIPVLAHAERYRQLFDREEKNGDCMKELKDLGCRIQINVYSVFDEENETIKQNALDLVKNGYVDFLGTDAHRMNQRPPSAEAGLRFLYENFDKDYIDRIAFLNGEELLKI